MTSMSPSSPGFLKAWLPPGEAHWSGFLQLPLLVFGQGRVGRVCVNTIVAAWAAKEEGRGPGPDLGLASTCSFLRACWTQAWLWLLGGGDLWDLGADRCLY